MRSLRGTLLVLVLPPLVLLTGAGTLVAWNHWSSQAAQAEAGLRQGALTLMRAVDRELMLDQVATETLATSPLIDRGDWVGLRGMAMQVAQRRDGMLFALVDGQGRNLFNTAQPADAAPTDPGPQAHEPPVDWHGHALPRSPPQSVHEALAADRPVYSNLYFGLVVQRPALAVVVPVRRAGRPAYALTCSFSPEDLSRLLQTDRPPGVLQVWMADRAGNLIASTVVGLESVGRPMPVALLERLRGHGDGVLHLPAGTQTVDRVVASRVAVAAVSPLTGWLLVIESAADAAYADARRLLVGWLLATVAVVAATAWVAARRAAQLSRPLLRLARSAMQPLQARRVQRHAQQRPVEVREIAILQQALQRADDGEQLRQEESLQLVLARERERLARRAAEDSRERETQLRLALEAGRMGFWRLDLMRRELTSDATHRQLWGLPGRPDRLPADVLASRVHPDDRAAFFDAQRRAAAGEHLRLEFRILLDGEVRWLHCEADAPPPAVEGAPPTALLGVDLDVTEQRLLREALQERSRALERADQEKNRFLAMLGHELRNPLAPIRASADLLCRLAGERCDIARAAERVQRQAGHLTRLIDDLLDIGRITQGKIELRLAPVDLADVLREAVEAVRPLIDSRGHRLVLQGPSAPLHVRGDATRLLQVVANLLGNAAKYTDEGGKIRLTLAREGPRAVITVEDNGSGLPREALPTLFDPFTQVRGTLHRAEGGLGIGLAVVRRLVELHGGQVEAHSEGLGRGTTLSVWLPRAEPPGGGPATSTEASSTDGGTGRRVLVVDDNQDGADSMAELLGLAGHRARVAYSGSAALALADDFEPEVAVLDIGLPDLDGCELAVQLRSRRPTLRLIALTGRAGDDEDRRMREAGFDHRLVKPADAEQVLDLLRESAARQEKSP
ncbi:ATP-binding protein [Aquabacterium sp. J223]|uniref:hybrid sensor histidine kinase/response regulator n=1 Tax=Aquabacterium sp. J223 TaxID=2898431 RepID=UPI0021AE263F|nr:ATP-binding protein [Aquabacterium sp. J223]UUX94034.1 ATP-binding protein [Aquabacterium sp. J223]